MTDGREERCNTSQEGSERSVLEGESWWRWLSSAGFKSLATEDTEGTDSFGSEVLEIAHLWGLSGLD